MSDNGLIVFGIGAAIAVAATVFHRWRTSNAKRASDPILEAVDEALEGAEQATKTPATGITEHIIEGVAQIAEHAAEQAIKPSAGTPMMEEKPNPDKSADSGGSGTPNFGVGGA